MSEPDPRLPTAPVPGPLRSAARWRKLAIAVAVALPVLGFLVAIPFANRAAPIVLGLPFLQFWTTACIALTGVCLTVVFHLDPRNRIPGEPRRGRLPRAGEDTPQGAPRRHARNGEERGTANVGRSNAADRRADPGAPSC